MTRGRTLLIDDLRCLQADVVARTFDEGIQALMDEDFDLLKLDHDLGDPDPRKTGYGVLQWIEEFPEHAPRRVQLVTANPVGMGRMAQALEAMGYRHVGFGTDRWERQGER